MTSSASALSKTKEWHGSQSSDCLVTRVGTHIHTTDEVDEQEKTPCEVYATVEQLSTWFPYCDPENEHSQTLGARLHQRPRLLLIALITASSIFVTNLVILCVIYFTRGFQHSNGFVSIFKGSCNTAQQLSIGLHIIINILNSGLLAASNLCMQLTTAPTRAQIDEAHQKDHDYYDIGILSMRNWRKATIANRAICAFLILSSLPLHFIYNSAISTTNPQFAFPALVVTNSFLEGAPLGQTYYDVNQVYNATIVEAIQKHANDPARYRRIEKHECAATYSDPFRPHSNLVIVTEDHPTSSNSSLLEYMYFESGSGNWSIWDQQVWICSEGYGDNRIIMFDRENPDCSTQDFSAKRIEHWQKWKHQVQYCLTLAQTNEVCSVSFSPVILVVVCICNFIKCVCILYCLMQAIRNNSGGEKLCTIGDAIASFLEHPTPMSTQSAPNPRRLLTQDDRLEKLRTSAPWVKVSANLAERKPARWYTTVSPRYLRTTIFLCIIAVVMAIIQLIFSVRSIMAQQVRTTVSEAFNIGFGKIDPSSLLVIPGAPRKGASGFIASTLYANYWQVLVSILYFSANSLLTRFHVSHEWSRYAKRRKFLRVSQPRGMQRSSYFISLPYRYGAPLLIASVVLNLLISQSIFLVNGTVYVYSTGDPNAQLDVDEERSFVTAGTNCVGILVSIIFGAAILFALVITAYYKRLDSLAPIVSSDSRSIQAHCQAPLMDKQAHLFPVQLASVPSPSGTGNSAFHYAFTTHRNAIYPDFAEGRTILESTTASDDAAPSRAVERFGHLTRAWNSCVEWSSNIRRKRKNY